jgi:acetyl esterase
LNPDAAAPAWHDEVVPVQGGADVTVRIRGCASECSGGPLVLHFHAGAFVGGSLEGGTAIATMFTAAGAAVASLDYPLAPAHPFPQAAEAGYAALAWIDRQRKRLATRSAPLFVAGEEAGGNIAAAVAMMARDRNGPALAGQILLSPMLDMCVATASQRDAQAGPVGCVWADGWRAYLSCASDVTHPYATPGSSLRLAGLPPTLLVTAQDDPLRDETLAYARRLRGAGVSVEIHVLPITTGWPRSYLQPGDAPWSATLREHIQPFLASVTQQAQLISGSPA